MLRIEDTTAPLSKAERYGHPYSRKLHNSTLPPATLVAIVLSYLEYGMQVGMWSPFNSPAVRFTNGGGGGVAAHWVFCWECLPGAQSFLRAGGWTGWVESKWSFPMALGMLSITEFPA